MLMAKSSALCKNPPLSKRLTCISKLYYGVVTQKLKQIGGLERYYYTLIIIDKHEGKITQKALSEIIETDKVFTVKILDYLTEKNLIRRIINPEDRREHHIELTAKAQKIIPFIAETFNEVNDEALKGVSKENREIFFDVLDKIQSNLLEMPADLVTISFKNSSKK